MQRVAERRPLGEPDAEPAGVAFDRRKERAGPRGGRVGVADVGAGGGVEQRSAVADGTCERVLGDYDRS